jgi:exopolysaccharide biosynthesis WecB/TagA/CpsF family protein/anti-anti-sigma factor
VTTLETLDLIGEMVRSRTPHYAATANVDFLVHSLEDVELRRILFDAHLVVADGQPIVWASRFLGNPLPERVTGSGLVPLLLERAEREGWKVFFLGGTEQSVAAAAARTRERHPAIQLVGAYSPPFKPLLEMDHTDIIGRIRQAAPDILLVAFGCPKQEKWIWMNLQAAGVPFSVGVGATIDFLAGTFSRAPLWMQKTGTEWIYRLFQEPSRLAKRYAKDLRVFGIAIVRQWWQMRNRPPHQGNPASTSTLTPPATPLPATTPPTTSTVVPPDSASSLALSNGASVPHAVIIPPARIDAASAATLQPDWLAKATASDVLVDLSGVSFIDSTGIGLLVRLRKTARESKRGLILFGMPPAIRAILASMKLLEFFPAAPDQRTAQGMLVRQPAPPSAGPASPGASPSPAPAPAASILAWQGEITAANAGEFVESIQSRITSVPLETQLNIDLSQVDFIDSTGVGLLLRLKRETFRRHQRLTYSNPSPPVRNVLRITRLEGYLLESAEPTP